MELKFWSLYKACYIILLMLTLGRMYEMNVCKLETQKGEKLTINGTCGWSDWLDWSCSCCDDKTSRPFTVRKRAICCPGNSTLKQCISDCNYTEHSDTMYGNCSTECVGMVTASGECQDKPPHTDTVHIEGTTAHGTVQFPPTTTLPASSIPSPSSTMSSSTLSTISPSSQSTLSSTMVPTVSTPPLSNLSFSTSSPISTSSPPNSSSAAVSSVSTLSPTTLPMSSASTMLTTKTSTPLSSGTMIPITQVSPTATTLVRQSSQPTINIHSPGHNQTTASGTDTSSGVGHSSNYHNTSFTRPDEQISTEASANETSEAANHAILPEEKSHVGVILGAVFGSLVGLGAVAAVLFFPKRAKRKTKDSTIHPDNEHQLTDDNPELDNENDEL